MHPSMDYAEIPISFACEGATLVGVLARPERPAGTGVVIVVGGPQYRVGSHRQFVLLARALAEAGFTCLRFDYRGMGDSDGPRVPFEQTGPDIRAAVDALCRSVAGIERVVLWGLCDGAAASALFAPGEPRVAGLALFNPWVRTAEGEAEAMLKHYYRRRLLDARFWRKLRRGDVHVGRSLASLWRTATRAFSKRAAARDETNALATGPLPERVGRALLQHDGPVLIALSERDTVAAEFELIASRAGPLCQVAARPNAARVRLEGADHTFSSAQWRNDAATATVAWLHRHFTAA